MIKIERNNIYKIDDYSFKNFIALSDEEKIMVCDWRNDERVRKWMSNNSIIKFEDHLKFLENLKYQDSIYYWIVYKGEKPFGVVNLRNINFKTGFAESGYYINPNFLNSGIGLSFNFHYRYFYYNVLGLEIIIGYVLKANINACLIFSFFGGKNEVNKEINGIKYIIMYASKKDFNNLSHKTLLRDFVKYSKISKFRIFI
ncbi:MAG: GNAT family N-acetyltransferase [Bacteroidales bacterium]